MERDKFFKFLFYLYLFLSLSFLILKIDPLINNVRIFVSYLFDPSFSVGTINKFKDINYKIRSLLETEMNNIKLQEENRTLKARLMDFERLEKENLELKEILDVKKRVGYQGKFSKVISTNPRKPYSFIYIDKGKNDGIELYNPVVSYLNKEWVLIGRITEVYDDYSKVILITNSNFSFIADSGKSRGLLTGDFSNSLNYRYIDGEVKLGDEVFTSKASMTFPPFIKIGKIADVAFNPDPSLIYAKVSVFNIKDVDLVYVINFKPYKDTEQEI